jgi:hypothetical protein
LKGGTDKNGNTKPYDCKALRYKWYRLITWTQRRVKRCLSAFTAIGKANGMKDETLATCRVAGSADPKMMRC